MGSEGMDNARYEIRRDEGEFAVENTAEEKGLSCRTGTAFI